MPYSTDFILTTVEGTITGSLANEIWRTSWKIPTAVGAPPTQSAIDGYLSDIASTVSGFFTNGGLGAGNSFRIASLSAAVLGPDGLYLGGGLQETSRYTYPTPPVGSGTTNQSWSTSLCLSMRTARARGAASRGRMYWPASALTANTDGLLASAGQTALIAQAVGFLNNINSRAVTAFGGGPLKVAVMSNLGTGITAPVTHVSIGRKFDDMESREGKLSEDHMWTALTGAAAALQAERDAWREHL